MDKKKFFMMTSSILFFLLIFSCSLGGDKKKTLSFAYVSKEKEQSFHDSIANGVKKAMASNDVKVDIFYAKNQKDVLSQRNFIGEIIKSKKYSGVLICPNSSSELNEDIARLDRENIPFVVIDTFLNEDSMTKQYKNYCGYVGTDNFLVGKMAFDYISKKMFGGNILLVRGVHTHRSSIDREIGFLKEANKFPRFRVVAKITGDWRTDIAHDSFEKFMKINGKRIDAVFAYNDHMATGISDYYEKNKVGRRPIIVGVDATVLGQKALLDKKIDAIVVQATELMGIEALNKIIKCSNSGQRSRSDYLTPVTMLTTTRTFQRTRD